MRGLLQLVGWRNASLQDVGLICPNELAHAYTVAEMQSIHHIHNAVCAVKLQIVFIVVVVVEAIQSESS